MSGGHGEMAVLWLSCRCTSLHRMDTTALGLLCACDDVMLCARAQVIKASELPPLKWGAPDEEGLVQVGSRLHALCTKQ